MCVDVIPALLRLEGCGNAHSVKGVHGNFAVNKREANRYEEQTERDGREGECLHMWRALRSNDLKLSDCGGRRGSCAVGLRGAGAVTPGAVRCSAWFGVAVECVEAIELECLEGLAGARWPGNLEGNRTAAGLHGEREAKKAATDLLLLDDARHIGEQARVRGEMEAQAVGQVGDLVGALEEAGQKLLTLGAELAGRKVTGWAGGTHVCGGASGEKDSGEAKE